MKDTTQQKKKQSEVHLKESPTAINMTSEEGTLLSDSAKSIGIPVAEMVRLASLEFAARLKPDRLLATPCPFCRQSDLLEIINWNHERPDGTEYQGDAVKCNRCDAVATASAWARLPSNLGNVIGGEA